MVCLDETAVILGMIGIAAVFLQMGSKLEGLMRFLKPLFFFLSYLTLIFTLHTLLIMLDVDATYAAVTSLLTTFEIINLPIMVVVFFVYVVDIWNEMGDELIGWMRKVGIIRG